MSEPLSRRLLQTKFEGPHHEALLGILLAHSAIDAVFDDIFDGTGITQQQYNVLRILNGAYPNSHPRCEIARRMVRRAPDLTRMLDRLVRMELVEREKGEQDHRQSLARITEQGRTLIERLHPRVQEATRFMAERLSADEAQHLSKLLERIYSD